MWWVRRLGDVRDEAVRTLRDVVEFRINVQIVREMPVSWPVEGR
jgi:hypothetical protein